MGRSFCGDFEILPNEQVLPMVGSFIFLGPKLLPGFLIKINIKEL
jgi:hypothetical protein